jgi:hypothetical protein
MPAMKSIVFGVFALAAGSAGADPGPHCALGLALDRGSTASWWDLGVFRGKIDIGDRASVAGEFLRFGPRAMISRTVYLGAELDAGHVSGDATLPADGYLPRTTPTTTTSPTMAESVSGNFVAAKAVIGARLGSGSFSGGIELAAGVRHASLSTPIGLEVATLGNDPFAEGHARLDLRISPAVSIGAIAGLDLQAHDDVSFGLVLGVHFPRR